MAVAGSPAYLTRRVRPTAPHDLTEHDCIRQRLPTHGGLMNWEFKRRGRTVNAHFGELRYRKRKCTSNVSQARAVQP